MLRTFVLTAAARAAADLVVQPADQFDPTAPAARNATTLADAGGDAPGAARANGYLATWRNGAAAFRAPGPAGGAPCGVRTKTSATARTDDCGYVGARVSGTDRRDAAAAATRRRDRPRKHAGDERVAVRRGVRSL